MEFGFLLAAFIGICMFFSVWKSNGCGSALFSLIVWFVLLAGVHWLVSHGIHGDSPEEPRGDDGSGYHPRIEVAP